MNESVSDLIHQAELLLARNDPSETQRAITFALVAIARSLEQREDREALEGAFRP
jgi:hypothetical protein